MVNELVTKDYALYLGDSCELLQTFPKESIHLSVYSPPFGGLYHYSSSENDLSNSDDYDKFFEHYEYIVKEIARLTIPGRHTGVHCMDVPSGNTGIDFLRDFPGDIIRLHKRFGLEYVGRYCVWKEPLGVRNRLMSKNLAHKTIVEDSSYCSVASADYLLMFRKRGVNPIPIFHPNGLLYYAGSREIPKGLLKYKGYNGNQIENRYSHWIWRQYASSFWDDVRIGRVLPYKESKEPEDEKHIHPLQLDVVDRCIILWSNKGENVLTPFMGVGTEVHEAVILGRKGIGIELKESFFNQSVKNLNGVKEMTSDEQAQLDMFNQTEEVEDELYA